MELNLESMTETYVSSIRVSSRRVTPPSINPGYVPTTGMTLEIKTFIFSLNIVRISFRLPAVVPDLRH